MPLWTPNLTTVFQEQHGYHIEPYLSLLSQGNGDSLSGLFGIAFQTDAVDTGQSYVSDFRSTRTKLYGEYLQHWTNWSNSFLGLEMSAQVGYNLPVDMLQLIPLVDAPETESLAFSNVVDAFIQYSGPANLAGTSVVSIELAAQLHMAYQLTMPSLLESAKKAFAGGVNMVVIHGSPYSYEYPNTTWPGFTTFEYQFSEMHQRHQPAWDNGYSDVIGWLARSQYIQQMGVPKRDFAFWDKQTAQNGAVPSLYAPLDLGEAGYTYDYLSPENFNLPSAVVTGSVLASDGPGYKALVLRSNDTLTVTGVTFLAQYAQAGLPIIAAGGFPMYNSSQNASAAAYVQDTIASLSTLANVHIVPDEPVASVLQSIGIVPRAQVSSNSTWYTTWRSTASADYVFIYNDGAGSSAGSIKFASTATPYVFDPWTGAQTAILNYTVQTDTIEISITLAANQSTIITFSATPIPDVEVPSAHFIQVPDSVIGFSYSNSSGLMAKTTNSSSPSSSQVLLTSDGTQTPFNSSDVPLSFALQSWTLIAEHWDPPSNISDVNTIATKSNTTHSLSSLIPWDQITGLANTSGLGYYNTTFSWPPATGSVTNSTGAIIDFGPIVHTLQVQVNGRALPVLDITSATFDITPYLITGANTVEAKIATTLYNVLAPIWTQLRSSGTYPAVTQPTLPTAIVQGLVGQVLITPYLGVPVSV